MKKLRLVTPETAQGRNEIVMTPLGHDVLGMFDDKGVFWKAPPPLNETLTTRTPSSETPWTRWVRGKERETHD